MANDIAILAGSSAGGEGSPAFTPIMIDEAQPALRLVEVLGDGMEPTLRRRDFALCRPVIRYEGEGLYLIWNGLGETFYRVDSGYTGLRLMLDNPLYSGPHAMDLEDFNRDVRGKVVADVKVRDHGFITQVAENAADHAHLHERSA